jgi:hypothetical protein
MEVNVLDVAAATLVEAVIVGIGANELPSMQEGWHFNFAKQLKGLKNCTTYALKIADSEALEGCMAFQLQPQGGTEPLLPFMPLLEVAPHNFGQSKRYNYVAGCLLAYAYLLSSKFGQHYNKDILAFEVGEKNPAHEIRLMSLYCQKYGAKRWEDSNLLFITKEAGNKLIEKYLVRS